MKYQSQLLFHGICIALLGLAIYLIGTQIRQIRYDVKVIQEAVWNFTQE